jgi:tetratricopeptide (TPR) repeat protein
LDASPGGRIAGSCAVIVAATIIHIPIQKARSHALLLTERGDTARWLGDLAAAEKDLQKVIERTSDLIDPVPVRLNALNNLALVYHNAHRFAEAELLHREELSLSRKLYGDDHEEIFVSSINLAMVLNSLERASEARELLDDIAKRSERLLGAKHPTTLLALSEYAHSSILLSRAQEAIPILERTLASESDVRGERHYYTMRTAFLLFRALLLCGRRETARKVFEHCLRQLFSLPDTTLDQTTRELRTALSTMVEFREPSLGEQPKAGRNNPCPCGSGKKFKRCCGRS